MLDILPKQTPLWRQFETIWQNLAASYGYDEIRLPIIEATSLFKRSIGEVTDIVEKEMFCFQTKEDSESLSLRPEGTAGCVRAGIENSLLRHQIQRLWYMGPMFRHETPQKGRYRQFHQVGVEAFGMDGPDIEAEHILMMARFWKALGIESAIQLQINSIGSAESRKNYRNVLVDYLSKYQSDLDADSQRRLHTNPLRILDSKNPKMADIIANAPLCYEYLDPDSTLHFEKFTDLLTKANIAYTLNPNLVRGLDYYNRTVYEWVTDTLGAQGTVCAGGRYDSLVAQLGADSTPAVGFAMGIERVLLVQEALGVKPTPAMDAYLIHVGATVTDNALSFAEDLRTRCPTLRLILHCGGGDFKQQFKKADKSGARIALILGEQELLNQTIGIKFLREERPQIEMPLTEINQFLMTYLAN